jgi:hypothetical protein
MALIPPLPRLVVLVDIVPCLLPQVSTLACLNRTWLDACARYIFLCDLHLDVDRGGRPEKRRSWAGALVVAQAHRFSGRPIGEDDWERVARKLLFLHRRNRTTYQRQMRIPPTWKRAVLNYVLVQPRCQACSARTQRLVFGTYLCSRCTEDPLLPCTFMVPKYIARHFLPNYAVQSLPCRPIPMGAHLIFWRDVVDLAQEIGLPGVVNTLQMRAQILRLRRRGG